MPGCLFEQLLHLWPRRELENQIACTDSRDVIVHLGTTVFGCCWEHLSCNCSRVPGLTF